MLLLYGALGDILLTNESVSTASQPQEMLSYKRAVLIVPQGCSEDIPLWSAIHLWMER